MKIGIIGAGKVGGTIATLLESCAFCKSVSLADARANIDLTGLTKSKFVQVDVKKPTQLAAFVKGRDAVVSAAPWVTQISSASVRSTSSSADLQEKFILHRIGRALKASIPDVRCALSALS